MRIYSYSLQTFGSRRIFIGKQGENAATRIDIDVTPWRTSYPDSVIALYVKPPSGNGYLAALGDDGKTVRWTVMDTDTAYAGIGSAELMLQNAEGTVIKSVTADTSCLESPSAEEPSEPPEAIRPWVEQILDAIANAGVGGGEGSGGGAPGVGGITEETDPTVPDWAKQPSKPTYTASEVGALPSSYTPPVTSVNGKTGAVVLSAQDVRARPDTWTPTADDVGADAAGTASGAVAAHNTSGAAHADLRALIEGLTGRLNALADSDDTTLDQLSEIVAYIKSNRTLIDAVTTGKVSVSDIVDNLTTNASGKVLSAAQGVALKGLIDAIVIPDKLPNPQPLTINGQSYDGSAKVDVTVTGEGGGANIDDTTPSSTTTYSSQKIESELNTLNTANATQDEEIAKKANDKDLAAVAKSGSYNDLTDKPTIPTVPTTLPNPNKFILTGAVTAEYDGSAEVSVEIPAGGGYTLPVASPTTLGGVMPAAKTDEMTQAVGVDDAGGLWTMAGGGSASGSSDYDLIADLTLEEDVSTFKINVDAKYKHLRMYAHGYRADTGKGLMAIETGNGWKLIETNRIYNNNDRGIIVDLNLVDGKIFGFVSNGDVNQTNHKTVSSGANILHCENYHASGFEYIQFRMYVTGELIKSGYNVKLWGA